MTHKGENYSVKLQKYFFATEPATKHIPEEVRQEYPFIPWRKMAGIKDIIIHAYFGVNLNVVWNTANERLPELKRDIEKILEENNLNKAFF